MSDVKRCAACGKENPVSEMKVCMHHQMHRYVCDSKCMTDFYNPPKKPTVAELQARVAELQADLAKLRAGQEPVLYVNGEHLALALDNPDKEGRSASASTVKGHYCDTPLYTTPLPSAGVVTDAARDVLAERERQISAEGMTNAGDDGYRAAELPRAAAAYILNGANDEAPAIWPWAKAWWKPRDARANYVRAGALILAEIERLDRLNKQEAGSHE